MRLSGLLSILPFILSPVLSSPSQSTPSLSSSDLLADITSLRLSPEANVIFPSSPLFQDAVARWDPWSIPSVVVAIEAATVSDVQQVISYVRRKKLPLLVKNSSHGFTATVADIKGGVQLSMGKMNNVEVVEHGKDKKRSNDGETGETGERKETNYSIVVGGGVKNAQLVDAMFNAGLRTSTGGCDCVGVAGLALGGGHGKLQGLYGIVSDTIEEVEMVTADGKVRVLNEKSKGDEKDLWWAIRGAGHNFGVVTKMTLKAWEKEDSDDWIDAEFLYAPEKLPDVFNHLNEFSKSQPDTMTIFTGFRPSDSPVDTPPSVRVSIQYGGGPENFPAAVESFHSLGPFSIKNITVPLNMIATATGIGLNMGFCLGGVVRRGHYSAQVKSFDIPAVQEAYEYYGEVVKEEAFRGTSIVWESYPQRRFKEIDPALSAYPWRDMNIISLVMVNFEGEELQPRAIEIGKKGRDILHKGSGVPDLRVYVNYAQGDEGQKVWYGGGWRYEKLRRLKKKFDPNGIFNDYNPILV